MAASRGPRIRGLSLLAVMLLFACQGARLPDGQGLGLVEHDPQPPAGAPTFDAPALQPGDRFVYRSAELHRIAFQVTERSEAGYVMTSEAGMKMRLTPGLADRSEEDPDDPARVLVKDPPDVTYHWPLWPGKRWACHYLRKVPGLPAQALAIAYHCDALETVEVPAGSFRCLRIWRRARIATEESGPVVTSVTWYAPEVGFFVRRLKNGILTELERHHRGGGAETGGQRP